MDILAYEYLLDGLKEHNKNTGKIHGNDVVPFPTTDSKYPLTIFREIRNVANTRFNTMRERVASVGYSIDVLAKNKGTKIDKQTIAREVMKIMDEYLTAVGLERISYAIGSFDDDESIYHIACTYSGNLYENRRKFI